MHPIATLMRLAWATARRYVLHPALSVEDLVQEALAALLQANQDNPQATELHLYNIAHQRCRDIYRREIRRQKGRVVLPLELIETGQDEPISAASVREWRKLIYDKLDADIAYALDLHYLQGMTIEETARRIGIKHRRADYLLRLGRDQLKKILKSE